MTYRELRGLTLSVLLLACSSDGDVIASDGADAEARNSSGGSPSAGGESTTGGNASSDTTGGTATGGHSGAPTEGTGGDDANSEPFPPAPNDLDPGDGTLSTGGTLLLNGKASKVMGLNHGCKEGYDFENLYSVGFTYVLGRSVFVGLPHDQLSESRVFNVHPWPDNAEKGWIGADFAAMVVLAEDMEGQSGEVWVRISDGIAEVRFQDVVLQNTATGEATGDRLSGAIQCGEPVF